MITDFATAYKSADAAISMVKGIFALKSEIEKNQAVIDIQRLVAETQRTLFAAEQENLTSLRKINDLEAEILRMKDWDADKQRYELKGYYGGGGVAYALKAGMENGEHPHRLCAYCYDSGKKAVLQPTKADAGRYIIFRCASCKTEIPLSSEPMPTP